MRHILFFLLCFLLSQSLFSQPNFIRGKVVDAKTNQPLAFVNVVYNNTQHGVVTNMDGEFGIRLRDDFQYLRFSFLGYEKKVISKDDIGEKPLLVKLKPTAYDISEVKVLPGINPAHRIIHAAIENKDLNNPENLPSFSYYAYNRMHFTIDTSVLERRNQKVDSLKMQGQDTLITPTDSTFMRMQRFFRKQHIFLLEAVNKREYMKPDRNLETVVASRVSGLQNPSFSLLATQMQSFSFYNDFVEVLQYSFLSPLAKGSTNKYFFLLEDTIYKNTDTVFIISYRPYKNKNFEGLTGQLHINTNGYAIEHLIAETSVRDDAFGVKIQQQHEFVQNMQWFPVELNTTIEFKSMSASIGGTDISLMGIGKSYIDSIKIRPALNKRKFREVEMLIEDDAHKQPDEYWDKFRPRSLSDKDSVTYHVVDSIGEENNFDRILFVLETLASGYIPYKFLNIDITSIIDFNQYESVRLGLGVMTNEKVSRLFSIGGYGAYGFGDKAFKYGGTFELTPFYLKYHKLGFHYAQDVNESGGYSFYNQQPELTTAIFRSFYIANMDKVEKFEMYSESRALRFLEYKPFLRKSYHQTTNGYEFNAAEPSGDFSFSEVGVKLRYAYQEKFAQTPRGHRLSMGTDYPVLQMNVIRGMNIWDGEYNYWRISARITESFQTRNFGITSVTFSGGINPFDVPYPKLFAGKAAYSLVGVYAQESFGAMRMNEFISNRFVNVFFIQNFKSLLFRTEKFAPEIALVQNISYGILDFPESHLNINVKAPDKGYFESGVLFNSLLRQNILTYGIGVFYRYGHYAFPKTIDNFAFKLSIGFELGTLN